MLDTGCHDAAEQNPSRRQTASWSLSGGPTASNEPGRARWRQNENFYSMRNRCNTSAVQQAVAELCCQAEVATVSWANRDTGNITSKTTATLLDAIDVHRFSEGVTHEDVTRFVSEKAVGGCEDTIASVRLRVFRQPAGSGWYRDPAQMVKDGVRPDVAQIVASFAHLGGLNFFPYSRCLVVEDLEIDKFFYSAGIAVPLVAQALYVHGAHSTGALMVAAGPRARGGRETPEASGHLGAVLGELGFTRYANQEGGLYFGSSDYRASGWRIAQALQKNWTLD